MKDFLQTAFKPLIDAKQALSSLTSKRKMLDRKEQKEIKEMNKTVLLKDYEIELQKINRKYAPVRKRINFEYEKLLEKYYKASKDIYEKFFFPSKEFADKIAKIMTHETGKEWEVQLLNKPMLYRNEENEYFYQSQEVICVVSPDFDVQSLYFLQNFDNLEKAVQIWTDIEHNDKMLIFEIDDYSHFIPSCTSLLFPAILKGILPINYKNHLYSLNNYNPCPFHLNLSLEDQSFLNQFLPQTNKLKVKHEYVNPIFNNYPFLEKYLQKIVLKEEIKFSNSVNTRLNKIDSEIQSLNIQNKAIQEQKKKILSEKEALKDSNMGREQE